MSQFCRHSVMLRIIKKKSCLLLRKQRRTTRINSRSRDLGHSGKK